MAGFDSKDSSEKVGARTITHVVVTRQLDAEVPMPVVIPIPKIIYPATTRRIILRENLSERSETRFKIPTPLAPSR